MATVDPSLKGGTRAVRVKARTKIAGDPNAPVSPAKDFPGVRLINLIRKTLQERGVRERTLPDSMRITTTYWNSIMNGHRPIGSLPRDKMIPLARFLNLPLVQVYVLADHFKVDDFVVQDDLDAQLLLCLEKMRADPGWMALAPTAAEWNGLPASVKIAMAALYERVSSQELLHKVQVEHAGLSSLP